MTKKPITADAIAQNLIAAGYKPSQLRTADSRAIGQAIEKLTDFYISFGGNTVYHGITGPIKDFGVTIFRPDGLDFRFAVGQVFGEIEVDRKIPEKDGEATYSLLEEIASWMNGYGFDEHYKKVQGRVVALFDLAADAKEALKLRNSFEGIRGWDAVEIYIEAKSGGKRVSFEEAWGMGR